MTESKKSYLGIKRLAKAYTITIPAARKALMAHKVMTQDGQPVKPVYAKTSVMEDGTIWHQWEKKIAHRAFSKSGYKLADSIDLLGHAQGRHQADRQIDLCLVGIGDLVDMSKHRDTKDAEISKALDIYLGASFHDCHAIGGPCAVLMIHSPESCVEFIKRLHFVSMDYVATCKKMAKNDKVREKIDRYHHSIKRLSDWVQAQYFR